MYIVTKLFDKTIFQPEEIIQRFHFDSNGELFAVETNKSVYKLTKG